jgi:hypothetical protein
MTNTLAYLTDVASVKKHNIKFVPSLLLCLTNKLDCLYVISLYHACDQG